MVPDEEALAARTVLMVVGAGRGPLVRASLQAAEETGRKLKVYAVEKNPNAVVTLHSLIKLEGWEDMVTVVSSDMRQWDAPEKADILVFTFTHPDHSDKKNNQRYKKLRFEMPSDTGSALVHGFAGYFDSILYEDVHLGIEPSTATPNMFSWFPIFFPLRKPVLVPTQSSIEAHFWRCCGATKVWYEWCVTEPSPSPVHNSNDRPIVLGWLAIFTSTIMLLPVSKEKFNQDFGCLDRVVYII